MTATLFDSAAASFTLAMLMASLLRKLAALLGASCRSLQRLLGFVRGALHCPSVCCLHSPLCWQALLAARCRQV